MPYLSAERVAEIRKQLKATFPNVKFSVTRSHHSGVNIAIMSGPYECSEAKQPQGHPYQLARGEKIPWPAGHMQLNPFYLQDYEHADFLLKVYNIANDGNRIISEDGDYGSIPKFYVWMEIGKWDRPYEPVAAI